MYSKTTSQQNVLNVTEHKLFESKSIMLFLWSSGTHYAYRVLCNVSWNCLSDPSAHHGESPYRDIRSVMEKCYFPHTSYVSVSNAHLTNILFPVTIITSGQNFAVGVHIILGFSEETKSIEKNTPTQMRYWCKFLAS